MGVLHPTSRKVLPADVVGKTVLAVQHDAVNVLRLTFTDGSFLELWAEVDGSTGIPVIEVDPNAVPNSGG